MNAKPVNVQARRINRFLNFRDRKLYKPFLGNVFTQRFAMIKILSPAKINLFLHVTGKRPDGYHTLSTLMCRIGLYDTVSLFFGGKEIRAICSHSKVPQNEGNLAHGAAYTFFQAMGIKAGVKIVIHKQIPVAAGLGGGSSNAAAVLSGLNRQYKFPFSQDELMALGLRLGADVPFFLFEKPAIATGIGEQLKRYERLKPFKVLLVCPGISISTADIYKNLTLGLTNCKNKNKFKNFEKHDFDVKKHLCNDLEAVTASKYPEIFRIKKELVELGARGALMSGSGSTVFGLFSEARQARTAFDSLHQENRWQLYLVDMLFNGHVE